MSTPCPVRIKPSDRSRQIYSAGEAERRRQTRVPSSSRVLIAAGEADSPPAAAAGLVIDADRSVSAMHAGFFMPFFPPE